MTHKKFLARFAALVLALAMIAMTMGCGTGMSIEYGNSDISVKVSAKSGANVEYGSVIPVEVTIKNKTDTRLGAEVFFIVPSGFVPRYAEDVSLNDYNNYNKLPKQIKDSVFYSCFIDTLSNIYTLDVNIENALALDEVRSLQMNDEDINLLIKNINEFGGLSTDDLLLELKRFDGWYRTLISNSTSLQLFENFRFANLSLEPNDEFKYTLYFDIKGYGEYQYYEGPSTLVKTKFDTYFSKIGINVQAAYVGSSTNTPGMGYLDIGEMTFNVKNKAQ